MTDNVAVKITLFRCLNSQEIAIVKLKMISLPIFHYCFSASVCVCVVVFPLFSILNDFLSSLGELEGAAQVAHTWELLLGVASCLVTLMSSHTSLVRDVCLLTGLFNFHSQLWRFFM